MTIYRKPTHTDQLLDQSSYNPTSQKLNLLWILIVLLVYLFQGWRKVKSETLVRNPSPRLFDKKFRDSKKVKTNHAKTRLQDLSKTLPRFRDPVKIFRDPRFSWYHSPPLFLKGLTHEFGKKEKFPLCMFLSKIGQEIMFDDLFLENKPSQTIKKQFNIVAMLGFLIGVNPRF